jgi:hypothetical protein
VTYIQNKAVLNADETVWRVQGKTYYLFDPKRGESVLKRLFRSFFNGVLATVFWGA